MPTCTVGHVFSAHAQNLPGRNRQMYIYTAALRSATKANNSVTMDAAQMQRESHYSPPLLI